MLQDAKLKLRDILQHHQKMPQALVKIDVLLSENCGPLIAIHKERPPHLTYSSSHPCGANRRLVRLENTSSFIFIPKSTLGTRNQPPPAGRRTEHLVINCQYVRAALRSGGGCGHPMPWVR